MTALEIIMLIIGIVCFVGSFILTQDDAEPVTRRKGSSSYKPELTKEQVNMLKEQVDEIVTGQMSLLEESTEAAMNKISNTKIMEMNEYVETVLNEINKNHNETVFMYDMLNEKSKEIKNVVKEINAVKSQIDASQSTMKEETAYLENLIKEAEKAVKEMDIAIKAAYKTKAAIVPSKQDETPKAALDNVITPQFFEQKTVNQPVEPEKDAEISYMAKVEPEIIMASNCNEQILLMHSQGKSNLEIAKTLNLGMGEVKLVIDLFNKNK